MNHPEFHVYIAGPFSPTQRQKYARLPDDGRSDEQFARDCISVNVLKAKQLGVEVAKLGVYPVIPHANSDHPGFECQDYDFWIKGTLEQMRRCNTVLFTDDWQESDGASGENRHALESGMYCFYSIAELNVFIKGYFFEGQVV